MRAFKYMERLSPWQAVSITWYGSNMHGTYVSKSKQADRCLCDACKYDGVVNVNVKE